MAVADNPALEPLAGEATERLQRAIEKMEGEAVPA